MSDFGPVKRNGLSVDLDPLGCQAQTNRLGEARWTRYGGLAGSIIGFMAVVAIGYVPAFHDADGNLFGLFKLDLYDDSLHAFSGIWAGVAALDRLYSSLSMDAASSIRKDLYANYPLLRSARSASPLSACARRLSRHERTSSSEG